MKTNWIQAPRWLPVFAFLVAITSPFLVAQNPDSVAISKLLSDAKTQAIRAQDDADMLVSFVNSHDSWETHAAKLRDITTDVNEMGKIAGKLLDQRSQGSPWQQVAIDRIDPLLREMAGELTTSIEFLKKHQSELNMPAYSDYAHANYDVASRTASLISDLVEYGKAKSNSSSLQQRLELPAKTNQ